MTKTIDEPAVEMVRTVYMHDEDKEALGSISSLQKVSASQIVRTIFEDYLAGKLHVVKATPSKTSIWIEPGMWEKVRAKTTEDKVPISAVIAAGMRRLRGR